MINKREYICPQCGSPKMKSWAELTEDQKLLAKSLPMSAEYTREERKKHYFCTRCWFETSKGDSVANA